MKTNMKKEPVSLATTTRLGSFTEYGYTYHFYSAPMQEGFSSSDVSRCLTERYKKYGEVIFEKRTKAFSDAEEVLFTVIEPVVGSAHLN
jgi:hypothetical protein